MDDSTYSERADRQGPQRLAFAIMSAVSARSAVIDYRSGDFARSGPYDLILDLVVRRSVFAY